MNIPDTEIPPKTSMLARIFRGIWKGLDVFRRVIHLVLMVAIFILLLALLSSGTTPIPKTAALVIAPSGQLVEQLSGDPFEQAIDELMGAAPQPETSIHDLLLAIREAKDDSRIKAIALDLNQLTGGGMVNLQQIGRALQSYREGGGKVIAYGDFLLQPHYFIAAHADEVYLHPSGVVFLQGFGRYRMYMREALEKLRVDSHIFKVGEYKSFLEPYTRDDMSQEDREASQQWLDALWQAYLEGVNDARGLEQGTIERYIEDFVGRLRDNGGDLAKLALEAGLVDELRTRDQVRTRLISLAGEDPDTHSFRQVSFRDYLAPLKLLERGHRGDAVGLVVARGDILDGEQPQGTIGGDTLARLLRSARYDDSIKAVVLRVDSGGGSKFASEIVQREVQLMRQQGKPIIASMSNVAASGGYFISMDADEVWAAPTTITGSIGIGAHIPTLQNSLDALGLHVDGIGTTRYSGQFRPDRDLNESAVDILQLSIEHGYRDFVQRVAAAREMSFTAVDEVARGRVWIGSTAQQLNLVDRLGTLEEALDAAAAMAGLDEDYKVRRVEKQLSFRETLALQLAGHVQSVAPVRRQEFTPLRALLQEFDQQVARITRFNDPQQLYYYCDCSIR